MAKISIGTTISTNKPFKIDANEIIMGRTFLASITRYGKSWTNRRLIEQLVGKAGIVIVDPEGEYGSLREKFPFLIIGKDVPLELETAEFMAETVLKENLSVIIDLSLTDEDASKEYVSAFVKRFMFLETKLRKPYLFVLEEADEYCPERGVAKATSLNAIKNLAKKGGKRGVGLIVTTHRPAFVSKMVLSQCTTLKVIGRIEWDSDLDVIKEFLQISPTIIRRPKKNGKPVDDGLPHIDSLSPGEFYFTGSAVEEEGFVKVGSVATTHLGATPELMPAAPKELKGVIDRLSRELPKIIEKTKAALPPIEEIKKEAEQKAEAKYKKNLEKAKKKLEGKYKGDITQRDGKIKELNERVESISRQAALTPVAIADVLEHPIVRTTMQKLPERARHLLVKIEKEPNLTREQLAAFLSASRDTIANVVSKINRTFKANVIIGRGRPIKYRSMLKRLFITDVADREISEIVRLQDEVRALNDYQEKLITTNRAVQSENNMLKEQQKRMVKPELMEKLRGQITTLKETAKSEAKQRKEADKRTAQYKKSFIAIQQLLKSVEGVEILADSSHPEAIEAKETHEPAPKQEPQKADISFEGPKRDRARESIMTFLTNHSGISFTEKELALALAYDAEDVAFKNAIASLPSSVEKSSKGFMVT